MAVWIYTLVSVVVVSFLSLAGIFFLSMDERRLRKILLFQVSLAVGGLFGDAFFHLLPESFNVARPSFYPSLYVVSGILLFFILEKFVHWRHCHVPINQVHAHPVVTTNLVGEGVHNLIDGMLVGASYAASIPLGLTTTLAVVMHEIPHEIGNFGVYIHGGLTPRRALEVNFFSALSAVLGAVLSLLIGSHLKEYTQALLPITAGGFIYIAGSDLIPELQHEVRLHYSLGQFISIILGLGLMAGLVLME